MYLFMVRVLHVFQHLANVCNSDPTEKNSNHLLMISYKWINLLWNMHDLSMLIFPSLPLWKALMSLYSIYPDYLAGLASFWVGP